jgi:uncharacterized membrane protein
MTSRGTQDLINEAIARLSHRHPRELTDTRNFGVRMAAKVANGAGSWKFIISYLVFSALYTVGHQAGVFHFDPYPYQFYTFLVSVLAILLAQTILLFQNQPPISKIRLPTTHMTRSLKSTRYSRCRLTY